MGTAFGFRFLLAGNENLIGHPFQKELEERLDRPITMENDANCFTLAEARQGAARDCHLVFGITLGTGCGGGISVGGQIHTGRHHIAGEWGHFSVDPVGMPCYCGNRGCVETKISGGSVARAFLEHIETPILKHQLGDSAGVIGAAWIGP